MKKVFFTLLLLLIFISGKTSQAQDLIPNSAITGVCYAGTKVNRIFIPPPDEFFKKKGSKGGGSVTFYYTGFSANAKIAMEHAAAILESILPSDVNVTIQASWARISTAGVLGQSTITGYVGGWGINALNPNALYPVALGEKIAGDSLNAAQDGGHTINNKQFNSLVSWYRWKYSDRTI